MSKKKRARKQEQPMEDALLPEPRAILMHPSMRAAFDAIFGFAPPAPEPQPLFAEAAPYANVASFETPRDLIESALESLEKVPPSDMTGYGLIMNAKAANLLRDALKDERLA